MTVETPQPRDRVRWSRARVVEGVVEEITSDGLHIRAEDGRLHLCQVEDATVEVLERADDPSKALRGEVREIDGMSAVCYGKDYWVYFSTTPGSVAGYGIYRDAQMVGTPVIGAVPGTPAAEAADAARAGAVADVVAKVNACRVDESARPSVRVENTPDGLSISDRQKIADLLVAGKPAEAVATAHTAGLDYPAADAYVRQMPEYETYLNHHGRTEVVPTEADRMRAMGFDKQPEFKVSDDDRELIRSVLLDRQSEYFEGGNLYTLPLAGVVADIVFAAIRRDRERGGR